MKDRPRGSRIQGRGSFLKENSLIVGDSLTSFLKFFPGVAITNHGKTTLQSKPKESPR